MRSLLAYSTSTTLEEKLTLRIRADNSGDIYIPTAGYSPDGTQDCEYDWMVGIDDNTAVEYSGVGSSTGKIRVGYGLTPLSTHTVIIKPKEEDYGWLRAFGYKGTSIANSLTNIISDKSYKGYALSEIYTGNYFKAYQYYGCTNLINTDEELLPNTLEIIGDNYRAYEYSGCVKLVSNADERILKSVKVIGDNYRAYQYQNCTGINRIYMRAINWASVGAGYRDNQYSGTAADKSPMNIYIEGGIEEGGSWGLLNDRVKNIYVYDGLVSDYQTKLDTITSSKIKKNSEWDNFEYEFIEFDAIADSNGEIRIPVGGYSTTGTQDCAYDWYVSIDGGEPEEISGTGSASYVTVGESLEEGSIHRIIIKPKTIGWGWGRAFGYYNTGAEGYIKELIHDSYKCYATNRIETGAYYKCATYSGCTNLVNSYEKLPTSVTTVGDYYMKECNKGCTSLTTAFYEVMHKHCTLGTDYRYQQYYGCTSMSTHEGIAGYTGETYPTNYKYEYLTGAGDNANIYITRYEALTTGLTNSLGLVNANINKVHVFVDDIYNYENNTLWSNVSKYTGWYYGYVCYNGFTDIDKYTVLVSSVNINKTIVYEEHGGYGISWGLAVNRQRNFNRFALAAVQGEYSKGGSGSSPQALIAEFKLNKAGDLSTTPQANTGILATQQSTWSGGNYTFVGGHRYTRMGKLIYNNARNGSNYDYGGTILSPGGYIHNEQGGQSIYSAACISDNGLFAWCGGFGTYRLSGKESATNPTRMNYTNPGNVGLTFSNDGLKMYTGYETIKEYSLSTPRDMGTAVDTGRSLSIGSQGSFDISVDGKYLFVYRDGTIYQYTYE